MNLKTLKWTAAAVLVMAMVGSFFWQLRQSNRLSAEGAALREELQQVASLREADGQFIKRLKADAQRSDLERAELLRLRAQASRLRQTEQENAELKRERERLVKQAGQSPAAETQEAEPTPEEKLLLAKLHLGRNLGRALLVIADDNDGRLPTEIPHAVAEVIELLSPELEGVNVKQYELVYKGSLREAKNPSDTQGFRKVGDAVDGAGGTLFLSDANLAD